MQGLKGPTMNRISLLAAVKNAIDRLYLSVLRWNHCLRYVTISMC